MRFIFDLKIDGITKTVGDKEFDKYKLDQELEDKNNGELIMRRSLYTVAN